MSCHQEMPQNSTKWYFSKEELETRSPSRKEGVSLKKENSLRLHYCLFLQDLGMKLGLPQVAIASAIMFCHRFYLYQSHARNDWQSIATVCLFLASKVEETPCALSKFIPASFEMIHKKDPGAAKRIQSKEIYEKHKELILKGERLVLATLGFDLEIQHPYKPLVAAIKKLGLKQNDLVKVAWNFVNDWLKTTLCLQYKSHYIAAGSLYLAAKVTKFKLPSEKGNVWWHEFDISPQLFEGVVRQMMLLVGYKGGSAVSSASNDKDKHAVEVENEDQCSPESCVLSRPGSVEDEANPNPSVKLLDRESEPIKPMNGNVKTFKEECAGGRTISEIDKERIKAALKRRRERETAKIVVAGDSSDEAWIEMELESGIEHVRTPVDKKPSL